MSKSVATSALPVLTPSSDSWCPGKEVNFTCVTENRQTLILTWMSYEYIGSGGNGLGFTTESPIGDENLKANYLINGTYAVLLVSTEERLVSILHLYLQFNGTVSCVILDSLGRTHVANVRISIIDGKI